MFSLRRAVAWMGSAIVVAMALLSANAVAGETNGRIPEGDYYIVAKHSLKALTASGDAGGDITLGQSDRRPGHDAAQLWNVAAAGDGGYLIRSRRYGTLLGQGEQNGDGDTTVTLKPEAPAGARSWYFSPHQNSYEIEFEQGGFTLNVTGASMDDDAAIIVYDASEDDNAQWLMYRVLS